MNMNISFDNAILLCCVGVCVMFILAILFGNIQELFRNKGATIFVIGNHAALMAGIFVYALLYKSEMFWLWKLSIAVVVFDVILGIMLLVKSHVVTHYFNKLDIEDGKLLKVYANSYLRTLKLPNDITTISNTAFANMPELEEIYFGKNVSEITEESLENCHMLHTLHFANPNTKYSEKIKEKYTIKSKH